MMTICALGVIAVVSYTGIVCSELAVFWGGPESRQRVFNKFDAWVDKLIDWGGRVYLEERRSGL